MDRNQHMQIVEGRIAAILEALFPNGAGTAPAHRVEAQLRAVAQVAFREGEASVLLSLLTAGDVAERLGVTQRRVLAKAKALRESGISVGWQVPGSSVWLFRPSELGLLQPAASAGRPRRFALHDWEVGKDIMCPVRREQQLTEGAVLLHVQHPTVGMVAVVAYADGAQFTPADWQGQQPQDAEDVADWNWVDETGYEAAVMDGLPRRFGA
jgi:hypothetical protein